MPRAARAKSVEGTQASRRAARSYRRTRQDHATELAEDYVELIADLIDQTGEARAVDLAACLGVSHVTVTRTVQRLQKAGLVTSEPYRSIFLTGAGKKMAQHSRRRHDLVLQFLLNLGVPGEVAEADAEGIEHHISPRTLQAMKQFVQRGG